MTAEDLAAIRVQGQSLLDPARPAASFVAPALRETPQTSMEEDDEPLLEEEAIGGATLLHAAVSDDELAGRCYIEMSFDASHLPTRDFAHLFFWKEALSHLPTAGLKGASFPPAVFERRAGIHAVEFRVSHIAGCARATGIHIPFHLRGR